MRSRYASCATAREIRHYAFGVGVTMTFKFQTLMPEDAGLIELWRIEL
jgi:hypothetical protein